MTNRRMRHITLISIFLIFLNFTSTASAIGVLTPSDDGLDISVAPMSVVSYDLSTRELTWNETGSARFLYYDGSTYQAVGINDMTLSLTAHIGMDGKAEGGSLLITGGIISLGIASGSTIFYGEVFDSLVTDDCCGPYRYTVDILMNPLASETIPAFDQVTSIGMHILNLDGPWPGTNIFDVDFRGGSSTYIDIYETNMPVAAVPEPATLALFGLGLCGIGLARRKTHK